MTKLRHVFICVLFAAAQSLVAAPQDPLWRKAIEVTRENRGWVPGLTIMRSEVSGAGETGVHETWQRSKLGPKGETVTEIVKVLEDGKDVTAKKKKSTQQTQPLNNFGSTLFHPKTQKELTVTATERTKAISDKECVAYEFQQKNQKGPTLKGTAWLEKETGRPMELEDMTFDPLPDKMKRMAITIRYAPTPEGGWQVKETVMKGVAGILFIKADFQTTMTFSEYWKKPQPEAISSGRD